MQYSEEQMTPWFSGIILPTRHGLYQVKQRQPQKIMNGWFEDGRWRLMDGPSVFPPIKLTSQLEWRGLNFEPRQETKRLMRTTMVNGVFVD